MLTFEDCIALCGLTDEEIQAIAEHERIPAIAATEVGNYLVKTSDGEFRIKAMIKDDLAAARQRADSEHELALKLVLRNFILNHPDCEERHRDRLISPDRRAGP